jgi:hypothetical protein
MPVHELIGRLALCPPLAPTTLTTTSYEQVRSWTRGSPKDVARTKGPRRRFDRRVHLPVRSLLLLDLRFPAAFVAVPYQGKKLFDSM